MSKVATPHYVRALLESRPNAGQGVHNWLFPAARALHPLYEDKGELADVLRAACSGCGREVTESEISDAITNRDPDTTPAQAKAERLPAWPPQNPARIAEISKQGPTETELNARSPMPLVSERISRGEEIIDLLFPGNPLLCIGRTNKLCSTFPREQWRGMLATQQLIVPSPMSGIAGRTKTGKPSRRTLDNTGPRRFLVIEFDPPKWETLASQAQQNFGISENYYRAKRDEQAALLWHLSQFGPLAAVVFSGSKSLHGWFYCEGEVEAALHKFMRYAVSLGADRATWTKNQFVRLPDGKRDNGKLQATIYLNPQVLP